MNWEKINNQLLQNSKFKIRLKEGTVTTIPYYNNMLMVSFNPKEIAQFKRIDSFINKKLMKKLSILDLIPILITKGKWVKDYIMDGRAEIIYKKSKNVLFFLQIHRVPEVSVLVGYNIKNKKTEFYLHTINYDLQKINLNQRGITLNIKGNKKMFHSSLRRY